MPIAKDKSVKPSTRRRVDVRVVPRISPKRAPLSRLSRSRSSFARDDPQSKAQCPSSKHRLA
jgi:hypothetical protein